MINVIYCVIMYLAYTFYIPYSLKICSCPFIEVVSKGQNELTFGYKSTIVGPSRAMTDR